MDPEALCVLSCSTLDILLRTPTQMCQHNLLELTPG